MTETTALLGRQDHLTFKGNLQQSRYGWLRLTPAYSVHLVAGVLDRFAPNGRLVLDPYCGTGTTALVCAEKGIRAWTTDINPFLVWLARAKTAPYSREDLDAFAKASTDVLAAMKSPSDAVEWLPDLHQIGKWWDEPTLHALGRGMSCIRGLDAGSARGVSDLLRIAFCRTLIERASVSFGHQSMSFKKHREQESLLPDDHLLGLLAGSWGAATEALLASAPMAIAAPPEIVLGDARNLAALSDDRPGCVITSPPYPNRMSYIRELRPYMYWLGYLENGRAAGELDWQAIGGTWGCATSNVGKWSPPNGRPIPFEPFETIVGAIGEKSDLLGRYVHKYFFDMVQHVDQIADIVAPGATLHYIVGNSKFYDVLLPVQDIYAAMFDAAGFGHVGIETIRKRSSKRELFEYIVSARAPG